jgi:hypothetical protein
MDDFQEQLPGAWVENENGAIDGLCGQVALKRLVDSYSAQWERRVCMQGWANNVGMSLLYSVQAASSS